MRSRFLGALPAMVLLGACSSPPSADGIREGEPYSFEAIAMAFLTDGAGNLAWRGTFLCRSEGGASAPVRREGWLVGESAGVVREAFRSARPAFSYLTRKNPVTRRDEEVIADMRLALPGEGWRVVLREEGAPAGFSEPSAFWKAWLERTLVALQVSVRFGRNPFPYVRGAADVESRGGRRS